LNARTTARAALANVLHYSGALRLHRHLALRDRALVLMYHRVLTPPEVHPDLDPGMFVTTPAFEAHLAFLRGAFEVVDLEMLFEWREGRRTFDRPPCAITFDDGWSDNYTNAFPLLQKYALPATIFLVTGQVGGPDRVTWNQVHEMERTGIRFGSHTATHPVVKGLPPQELVHQLAESKRQLHENTARPSCWFCYPKGRYDEAARVEASRHYCAAVTTRGATMQRGDNLWEIPRVGIHNDVASSTALFAFRISAW
jgi:peptidoglycan/xylan/chitin deacetylase (PgdA/CDA1 family)